ncbi:MAG: CotH kinase family protein [Lachnospiraceae bacterium]|nr:CotH kinase family protein [Lachnospiraceae bacterium]
MIEIEGSEKEPSEWKVSLKTGNKKRLLTVAAGALLAVTLFAGCSKKENTETAGNQQEQTGEGTSGGEVSGEKNPQTAESQRPILPVDSGVEGTNEYSKKLPVIYLETNGEIGEEYITATMRIDGNGQFEDAVLYDGALEIKLRGNSTRYRMKAPYKLKLDTKADMFGMGESKHWVLLANDIDHTLIRNKLVYDFAAAIGVEYEPESVLAALVVNDAYQGVYQFCEHIRVEENRVDILDWEEVAEDYAKAIAGEGADKDVVNALEDALKADYTWLNEPHEFEYGGKTYALEDYKEMPTVDGGFLLEADFYAFSDTTLSTLITYFQQPFYFNTPETVSRKSALYTYAKTYLQAFEYAIHSEDFIYNSTDAHYRGYGAMFDWEKGRWEKGYAEYTYEDTTYDGYHYSELFDMDSLVNNLLVCEFTMNWDCMKNSVFVYKDTGKKAKIGPVWDFDWSFGNINMYDIYTWFPEDWHTTNDYFTNEQYYQSVQWNRYLIQDPYFLMKLWEKYQAVREGAVVEAVEAVGAYREFLSWDGARNDLRWKMTYRDDRYYSGKNSLDFKKSFDKLEEFITTRVAWLDKQFVSLETLMASMGYYTPSDKLVITEVTEGKDSLTVKVQTELAGCAQVQLQFDGVTNLVVPVENGTATVELPVTTSAVGGDMLTVYALDATGAYLHVSGEPEADPISNYYYIP